jgi:mRNA-degrading endonuclease toxin of MazEF toxin-antitoxin module
VDARNRNERVNTVLAIPLSTSIHKEFPTHLYLPAGETGLESDSIARAQDIAVVLKADLVEPRGRLRTVSDRRICDLATKISIAMGCAP